MQRLLGEVGKLAKTLAGQSQADVDQAAEALLKKAVEMNLLEAATLESPYFKWVKDTKTRDVIEVNEEFNLKRIAAPAGIIASRVGAQSLIISSFVRILMAIKSACPMIFTFPAELEGDVKRVKDAVDATGVRNIHFQKYTNDEFKSLVGHSQVHDYLDESFLTCNMCPSCCIRQNIMGRFLHITNEYDSEVQGILSFKVPARVLFKAGCTSRAIFDAREFKKVFIITDFKTDYSRQTEYVEKLISNNGMRAYKFTDDLTCKTGTPLNNCLTALNNNKPNCIIAIGTPEIISFAKVAKLLYENPSVKPEDFSTHYSEFMRLSVHGVGECKCAFMAIPTTYDSSSVTPFAYINIGDKYTQIDTEDAIPNISIIDPDRVGFSTGSAFLEAVNAVETYCSLASSTYTEGLAIQALKMLLDPESSKNGETVANAAAIVGIAAGSSFYGLTKALAEELYQRYRVPEQATALAAFEHTFKLIPEDRLKAIALASTGSANMRSFMTKVKHVANTYGVEKLGDYVTKAQLVEKARCIAFHTFMNKHILACARMPTVREIENIVKNLL